MDKKLRLKECQEKYKKLAKSLSQVGFIWHGNLQRRFLQCANPKCLCKKDNSARHGPYPYWTTKVAKKTVTKLLTSEEADLYEQWIQNRRRLEDTVKRMKDISKKAAKIILTDRKHAF